MNPIGTNPIGTNPIGTNPIGKDEFHRESVITNSIGNRYNESHRESEIGITNPIESHKESALIDVYTGIP
ncbi:unnamed protein product [Rhizophagus irregularis]|nr:unnamed protein product [Rhizophagus irregularis]